MKGKALRIGQSGWLERLHEMSRSEHTRLWAAFTPSSQSELSKLKAALGRTLDPEFVEFYRTVGSGQFPTGGSFDSPEEILAQFDAGIYFVTGSMTSGQEWATAEEHRELWITRGKANPNRRMFTEEALTIHGVKLYDLMQFGSDGSCGYHQLYVGPEPAPFRYCLLVGEASAETHAATFSLAVEAVIANCLFVTDETG